MKDGKNYANDFVEAITQANAPEIKRDLPAMHPTELREKFVNLAEEEDVSMQEHNSSNLLQMPTGERKVHIKRFNLEQASDRVDYELVQNKCVKGRVGDKFYMLLREQWTETKDGDVFITVKHMTIDMPEKKKSKKGASN